MSLTAINLDSETLEMLDASAKARSLSREDTLREAIERLYDDLLEAAVAEGRAAIASGDFYTQEQIEKDNIQLRKEIMSQLCK